MDDFLPGEKQSGRNQPCFPIKRKAAFYLNLQEMLFFKINDIVMKKEESYPAHQILIENLIDLLKKGNAHASLDDALKNITFNLLGKRPCDLPYSIWQLTEHIRITQWDLLEFSRDKNHQSPEWPEGYWPKETEPASGDQWEECLKQINSDRNAFIDLLNNAGENLYIPFKHGAGQSLLKEALVLADHNSYHTGEIVVLRRLLNDWK